MLIVMVILHIAEIAVIGYCGTLCSLLNMVLAPFAEMWTQYWALEWTLWGVLVHLAVLLFLGSVFKTQAKDFQWLVGASCRRGLLLLNWVGQFCLKCMNRVFTTAPAAPATPGPATRKARGKSPGPAAAAAGAVPVAAAASAVKKARAKSPARKQSDINVGTIFLAKFTDGKKYKATVESINGDSCVIAWEDGDLTDTVKLLENLAVWHSK
jgi:hypothetical protein